MGSEVHMTGKGIMRFDRIGQSLLLFMMLLPLTGGCATQNIVAQAEVDRSIITSSTRGSADVVNTDEMTIRNAVTSANIEELSGKPIAWANRESGANGHITAITESIQRDVVCRRFEGTIESYEGVSVIRGETCLAADGSWFMRKFERS